MADRRTSSAPVVFLAAAFLFLGLAAAPVATAEDWLPITPGELALKDDRLNPGAPAIILYREQRIDDVASFQTNYYRLKILTEEGRKYADIELPHLRGVLEADEIQARTVRPDGTVLEFNGPVYERVVVRGEGIKFFAKTFALPEVQVGSIIEYKYKLRWPGTKTWRHDSGVGFLASTVRYLRASRWTIQSELSTRRARFSLRPYRSSAEFARFRLNWFSSLPAHYPMPQQEKGGDFYVELENIAGLQKEEYMPPAAELKLRVDFLYLEREAETPEQFWKQEGKQLYKQVERFTGKRKALTAALATLINPADPPEAKLRQLYARAQAIRNLSYEREKTEAEEKREKLEENQMADDVFQHSYAYAKEINYFFTALAQAAGFDTWIVAVAKRDARIFNFNLPDPEQLDSNVVGVRLGSEERYFDPGTPYCPFGLLPWAKTAAKGLRLTRDGGAFVTTPEPRSTEALVQRTAALELAADGTLQGNLEVVFAGQEALRRRLAALEADELELRKQLEDEVKKWLRAGTAVELQSVPNWKDTEKPLAASFSVHTPNLATVMGRRLLLRPALFQTTHKYPWQSAQRIHPIYFSHPWQEVDEVTVQLPEGYEVQSLPSLRPLDIVLVRHELSAEKEPGKLRLKRRVVAERYLYAAEQHVVLRDFFSTVRVRDEQPVVLQKSVGASQP